VAGTRVERCITRWRSGRHTCTKVHQEVTQWLAHVYKGALGDGAVAGTRVQSCIRRGTVPGTRVQRCTNSKASRSRLTIPDVSTVPHMFLAQGTSVSLLTLQKAAVRTTTRPVICAPLYIHIYMYRTLHSHMHNLKLAIRSEPLTNAYSPTPQTSAYLVSKVARS
jgi:hypothetical protein